MTAPNPDSDRPWWVSWYSPLPLSTFELHSPWWVSGYDADDRPTMCAALRADNEFAALAAVFAAYDDPPQTIEWRFYEEREADWSPFCDRFPKKAWMAWDGERTCACPAHNDGSAGGAS